MPAIGNLADRHPACERLDSEWKNVRPPRGLPTIVTLRRVRPPNGWISCLGMAPASDRLFATGKPDKTTETSRESLRSQYISMADTPSNLHLQQIDDATCLACGCMCDDIRLEVQQNRIVRAEGACPIGRRWFQADRPPDVASCKINGRPAEFDEGLEHAASLLCEAQHALVCGLAGATCEAQRVAVSLADCLGARLDAGNSATAMLAAAIQSAGMVTATLGEVRHRADMVIFWNVDPATTHPRHLERYSLNCSGEFVPRGRADRLCVVVSSSRTPTADAADLFLQLRPNAEAAALDKLRALANENEDSTASEPDDQKAAEPTGMEPGRWRELIERMKAASYGAIFFEPDSATESLLLLVRDMNRHTRFVALPLGGPGNSSGGHQVLTWQTGYSSPVDFAAGYPRHDDGHHSAEQLILAAQVDALLVVAQDPIADPFTTLSESARARVAHIPAVVLHTADCRPPGRPTVEFTVATPGIHTGGRVFRSDGVVLPLRQAISAPYPNAESLLIKLQARVRQTLSAPRS
jgi:formylmethanofuran dehydrogenase subunit B